MVRLARALVVPAALVGMVAAAGLVLGRIYSGPLLAQLVAGAAAGSVLLSAVMRRLPAWTVAPASVLGLAGYTVAAVRVSAERADVTGDLATLTLDAVRNSIPRLLTALIPVEPQPDTVVAAVVAAWLAGLAGAELALRGGRVLLGYAPPTLLFGAALYLVGPNAGTALLPTFAFVAAAAVGLAASATGLAEGSPAIGRAARLWLGLHASAGTATALVVVTALAVVFGPALAGRIGTAPTDPRRYVVPPQLDPFDENPLIRLSGWAVDPEQHLFDATVSQDARIRLAVLSDYDGVTWRVGATYRGAGRSLPRSEESTLDSEPVAQRITIDGLTGHLLPAVGVPRRVDGLRIAYDQASGTIARPEGLTPGLTYTVESARPHVDDNLLPSAEVPSGPSVSRLVTLGPGVPTEVERLAQQLAEGNAGAYQRASAIEQFLAGHYQLVADAPSGHAYPNLAFFLFGAREAGGQRGTSEQFAASFAVLARLLGLPSRVVVGFTVKAGGGPVRAADALAWPEVLFTDLGWVAFHPLPEPDTPPQPLEDEFRPKPEPSTTPPSEVPLPDTSMLDAPPAGPSTAVTESSGGSPLLVATAGSLGGVLLLGLAGFAIAVPLLRAAQRRRRVDRGAAADRVTGAWLEVTDALRLAGRPAGPHLTATEVARHAAVAAGPHRASTKPRVRLAAPTVRDLAELVNTTAFGLDAPAESDAQRARTQALAYVGELRARRPWWRRLLWTVHPGPLRWHRRS
ncbi:MAG TPA: transglutaminaseTgpA domain-containing protein [Micromonosporaceae bacterium]|nr:transglutaminaseTgpA domain-containing protein [Micromonosporaceae bacterium]